MHLRPYVYITFLLGSIVEVIPLNIDNSSWDILYNNSGYKLIRMSQYLSVIASVYILTINKGSVKSYS